MSKKPTKKPHSQSVLDSGPALSTATILFHEAVGSRLGLNATEMKCLAFINGSNSNGLKTAVTAGDVALFTGLTTGAVTGILDRLEKAKLISRVKDEEDRRKVILVPNAAAFTKIRPLYQSLRGSMEKLVKAYSEEELRVVADFLGKSTAILESEAAKLRSLEI